MTSEGVRVLCLAIVLILISSLAASAALQVIDSFYRPDRMLPEWYYFLSSTEFKPGDTPPTFNASGALCIYIKNTGTSDVSINDVTINGESLVNGIRFSTRGERWGVCPSSVYYPTPNQTLVDAGAPIWWRSDPNPIPPGGIAEVFVRMRTRVATTLSVNVGVPVSITVSDNDVPRVAGAALSSDSTKLFLYLRHPQKGKIPTQIRVDDVDLTSACVIGGDPDIDIVPVKCSLPSAIARGSFHCFQAIYDDGTKATAGLRMFYDEFMYGVWDSPTLSTMEEQDVYVHDMGRHSINRQEYGGRIGDYCDTPEGRQYMIDAGIYIDQTFATSFAFHMYGLFLCDEPDCGDFFQGVEVVSPEALRVGSYAYGLVIKAQDFKSRGPTYPIMLNLDEMFMPYNWYIYGHIADIFSMDPYYHNQLADVFDSRFQKLPFYTRALYIYAQASAGQAACEPRRLHVILDSSRRQVNFDTLTAFRWPTPEANHMENYYAIAAGAKQIAYWWMKNISRTQQDYNGIGYADQPPSAALWRDIGLVGAEFGTASEVIQNSCPAVMQITSTGSLFTRALVSGVDTLMLICINSDHANDQAGSVVRSIRDAQVSLNLPSWLTAPTNVFEVDYKGIHDVANSVTSGRITLNLGRFDLTRMIIITKDTGLKGRLQSRYTNTYGPRVNELIP